MATKGKRINVTKKDIELYHKLSKQKAAKQKEANAIGAELAVVEERITNGLKKARAKSVLRGRLRASFETKNKSVSWKEELRNKIGETKIAQLIKKAGTKKVLVVTEEK